MCLIIDKNYHKGTEKQCKIAKVTIPVYKIVYYNAVRHVFITPYQDKVIPIDAGYIKADYFQEEPISINTEFYDIFTNRHKPRKVYKINNGIHAYYNLTHGLGELLEYIIGNKLIYKGKSAYPILITCYIEKGTKYWVGEPYEICTEKLSIGSIYYSLEGRLTIKQKRELEKLKEASMKK